MVATTTELWVLASQETDVDCGGPDCPKCGLELQCDTLEDCESGWCVFNICNEPSPPCDPLSEIEVSPPGPSSGRDEAGRVPPSHSALNEGTMMDRWMVV